MSRRLTDVDTRLARDLEREGLRGDRVAVMSVDPVPRLVVCARCNEWWDECACIEIVEHPSARAFDVVAELIDNPRVRRMIGVRLHALDAATATAYARRERGALYPGWLLHAVESE